MEEEVSPLGIDGHVAKLINDKQIEPPQSFQHLPQGMGNYSGYHLVKQAHCRGKQHPVPLTTGF